MKSGNHVHIHGGTVGAVGVGDGASVVGNVSTGAQRWPADQEEHRRNIRDAQTALLRDQDAMDGRIFDALNQFLRMVREIRIEQKSQAEVLALIKGTQDEVWAELAARGLKSPVLPNTLEVLGALAKNPVMAQIVKNIFGA